MGRAQGVAMVPASAWVEVLVVVSACRVMVVVAVVSQAMVVVLAVVGQAAVVVVAASKDSKRFRELTFQCVCLARLSLQVVRG